MDKTIEDIIASQIETQLSLVHPNSVIKAKTNDEGQKWLTIDGKDHDYELNFEEGRCKITVHGTYSIKVQHYWSTPFQEDIIAPRSYNFDTEILGYITDHTYEVMGDDASSNADAYVFYLEVSEL